MRLYYHPFSSNSRRVLLTAHHLGLNLQLTIVDLLKGEHRTPEYLHLNPNGRHLPSRCFGTCRCKSLAFLVGVSFRSSRRPSH